MARTARRESKTGVYHVLLRSRSRLFLNDADRACFLSLLRQYFTEYRYGALYGYRMANNKVHLIIAEERSTLAEIIKPFCTSYARTFNRVHHIEGKLFNGRFKSEPLERDENLAQALHFLYRENPLILWQDDLIAAEQIKHIQPEKSDAVLCLDDYAHMSVGEWHGLIAWLAGGSDMSLEEKAEMLCKADRGKRIRKSYIQNALSIEDKHVEKLDTKFV